MSFSCPVNDQRFVLDHVVRIGELSNDLEIVDAVLEGAAALAEGEFAPLNRVGDEHKARWSDGAVTMPPGFKAAWRTFVDGGWMGLSAPESAGGQGLPLSLSAALTATVTALLFQPFGLGAGLISALAVGGVVSAAAGAGSRMAPLRAGIPRLTAPPLTV